MERYQRNDSAVDTWRRDTDQLCGLRATGDGHHRMLVQWKKQPWGQLTVLSFL